jgi:hypothetical protein
MKIKMVYLNVHVRMVKLTTLTYNACQDVEQQELSFVAGRTTGWYSQEDNLTQFCFEASNALKTKTI